MAIICVHDRGRIEAWLRRDVYLHIYGLGDLDAAFWPHTTWYGLERGDRLEALVLVYSGLTTPTVLALCGERGRPAHAELLSGLRRLLPRSFFTHLSPGLSCALEPDWTLAPGGEHVKMALKSPSRLEGIETSQVVQLTPDEADELVRFYDASYPGHWFEPQMLATGLYLGVRASDHVVAVAGVHVYSASQRVAALGNITTRPDQRGRGHSKRVTAALCKRLLETVTHVGLNVKADNEPARRCYESLGFEVSATYEEWEATIRLDPD